jgi:hypothetical protein
MMEPCNTPVGDNDEVTNKLPAKLEVEEFGKFRMAGSLSRLNSGN